jgi:hypothetical protein
VSGIAAGAKAQYSNMLAFGTTEQAAEKVGKADSSWAEAHSE